MNVLFTQDQRAGRLTTALGKDVLVLLRFEGNDFINKCFEYEVHALSTEQNLDFDKLIGTHASVAIESQDHEPRVFDGIVTQARWAGVGENGNKYKLILRPWFWLATRRRNQRIFHNKTVVQIIEELLADYSGLGKPHLDVSLVNSYPELEYTVQYRESDFNFACRLMEKFGISYHFRHVAGNHRLVLTDGVEDHPYVVGTTREYKAHDGNPQAGSEHFWEWHPERNMTTGAVRMIDYNFKTPLAAMEVERIGDAAFANGQLESFEYPGDYLDQAFGKTLAALRTNQERGRDHRHRAIGDCTSLGAGMRVVLTGDPLPGAVGQEYLCLSATHSYVSDAYGSGDTKSDGFAYSGSYKMMPVTSPLAPPRKTERPVVQGPQTAVVVGEGEIDCDEFGRVLVRFHWDLAGAVSMRVRVSQNWAHGGWGGMVIPRIGMEVIVDFLDGDPDKPIIVGCVYNSKNMPAEGLPAAKTKSGFKTKTHEGEGFNELTLEDQAGQEKIFIHAQKDLERIILDNESTYVDQGDRTITVQTGDQTTNIVTGNMTDTIVAGNLSQHVAKKHLITASDIESHSSAGEGGAGTTTLTATDMITLATGDSYIVMTPDAIVINSNGSQILLNADFIDQVAAMIHLNKDSAG
ncbi:type VI secretion system secreted protein VgrG [Cognatiyoonia koreensis]|uniref:Type VI secretion system secreted protein VgrG n=1 Tax=Cognatiyoonia koreensis TaxID=364200 RepID=A0A1I0RMI9_9RHOB|nr:type VI secretion system tip protein TssI/VgrG [Cognatiyoonia koreensis]SEW42171.1 type VI secretion system secreted protein VgrG [Cognatiyoonia koreensis]